MPEKSTRYQPPPQRRKTPSFSSSLLDSILRSIDENNDVDTLHHLQQQQQHHHHDHDLMFFASEPKRSQAHLINDEDQMPSLRRAIMIDQWMDMTQNNNHHNRNANNYNVSRKFSSDSSSSCTFTTSSESETPSTYRSLPNSFTISREAVFVDDDEKAMKREVKFMKSTRLRAMKIYGDLKKVKQPISSPAGSRISAFIYSLFASSSSKKAAKIQESMHNFRSRSIKQQQQDTSTNSSSFSRSCMSKKQHGAGSDVKRSVRFHPEENDTKSIPDSMPKYDQRRWFTDTKNYKNFMVNHVVEEDDDDDDEDDDLFELEIGGGVAAYRQELPVFETTDLRKIVI